MSRLAPQPGERIDRSKTITFTFDGKPVDRVRGRHDRLGAVRRRPAHVLPLLQVPPPPRPDVRRRPVPQLHLLGRRRPRRAGLRRAGPRGHRRRARQRPPSLEFDVMRAPTSSAARSRRPASTTRRSSARAGCGRCTRRSCATRPGWASCATSSRARVADRVPPPPRRRAGHRRRRRRPRRRDRRRRRGRRRRARRRGPEPGAALPTASRWSARSRATPASRSSTRLGARLLRRARARLAGRHAAPDPRRAARVRDRHDRAAAGVRRQRPARRDAGGRRAAAGRALRGRARHARGGRDDVGPRARRRARRCARPASRSSPSPTCARRSTSSARELRRAGVPVFAGHTVIEARGRKGVADAR